MRIFIVFMITLFFSAAVHADYTMKNVYRFDNVDMIKNLDDSNILNLTVHGVAEDSNGNKSVSKCLIHVINGVINGNCEGKDQDGDIEYTIVQRDINKGNVGVLTRLGGTGKYANKKSTCEYTVQLTDFKVGVGYLTATCEE